MIFRCKFEKMGDIAFVSHRDMINTMSRSLRRAGIDIKYSEGFNPHAKTSFSPALSLGVESRAEYMDVEMEQDSTITQEEFIERVNRCVPNGIKIVRATKLEKAPSLSSIITHSEYKITFCASGMNDEIETAVEKMRSSDYLPMMKRNKKGEWKEVDVRSMIVKIENYRLEENCLFNVILQNSPQGALKADDFMRLFSEVLQKRIEDYYVLKLRSYGECDGRLEELE